MIRFRPARREEVPQIVALLRDDMFGQGRESGDMDRYVAAFDSMRQEGGNEVIVGLDPQDRVVATYQLTLIRGLSLAAARRAQVESVRIASQLRGQGLGHRMFADVEARARAAGCALVQLTMNSTREDARRFYEDLGFAASHTGFKLYLDT
ncbi:Acetyltransferase (GNAT) family protein [Roseovarius tolerans]|uniref:Acetyltransferase (GNAT) family protein n=1 Tax=Roseovarius tolerans TaxID=74031 RepID=A0A1H8IXE3_9RHOB|nr:GNAT family N-acetyltransferase [Roseovarius tolerans]SEN73254.1 Acetyltransferase (GNAT) family protein [Roseovarius tolerans]